MGQLAPTITTPLADVRAAITLLGEALALEEQQALAIQSPLNLDTVLPVIREAAALAP